MSLKIREFVYGTFVGLLLLGGFIIGKNLQTPQSIEAYMGRGGPFSACGIEFSQGIDSFLSGTYTFNYYVKRSTETPLDTVINFQTKSFRCFCPEGLDSQGYCLTCDGGTVEDRTLPSGTSDINIPISMSRESNYCGAFQMDVAFASVNGNSSCTTLNSGGLFNGGVWGIFDARGPNCGVTPTPTVPVLTPTPTTPVLTPTPTIPVNTPTPTVPNSTPTPTMPTVSGTPTPTPTTPISTGTPTPTSPPGPTATPTPNTACVDQTPSIIRNLRVTRMNSTSVKLTWDKPEIGIVTDNAIKYRLSGRDFEYSVTSTGDVMEYVISSLASNTDYCFSVYAKNNCAPGPSTEVCTGKGQVLGTSTLPPTSSLPFPNGVILVTFYTLLSAGMIVRGWVWVKQV